ncbi:MAG TPA: ATP-binding protein [Hyphomicrobiales bacterium]|nr:ATP-binding protein [Hyphomicrobiales bacterium]
MKDRGHAVVPWLGSPVAALLDALPDPALIVDAAGTVQLANAEAVRLFDAAETPTPVAFLLRAPDVLEAVEQAAGAGARARVRHHQRTPVERWIEVHVAPVEVGVAEGDRAVLLVLHDLTQAERLERMRADFVANASHELRTPLASLSGFIDTLQGAARNDAAARAEFLVIMRAQAARMSRLIEDLLSLSRIELNEHVPPQGMVDLGEAAARVVEGLRPLAASEGVKLVLDRPVRAVAIRGDGDELDRLIENLVENGIKYGAPGKRVEVAVATTTDGTAPKAVLAVRDFGPGIAAEHLPRLTERFYRVDVGESRAKGGTGLGLALVKHITSRHRGRLAIESKPGEGALFTVRFDLAG